MKVPGGPEKTHSDFNQSFFKNHLFLLHKFVYPECKFYSLPFTQISKILFINTIEYDTLKKTLSYIKLMSK